jgi:uncharacterized protein
MILERVTHIAADRERVFAFFGDPGNLERLTPPWLGFEIVSCPEARLRQGDRIEYRIRLFGVPVTWVTRIVSWHDGVSFEDLQEKGPYAFWLHVHSFEDAEGGVRMSDRVEYRVPFGLVGWWAAGWWVRRRLDEIFDYRERAICEAFGA